ncbi:MAG: hypothetical protein ACJ74Q_10950 [Pyrinomonadaceae bacterium]
MSVVDDLKAQINAGRIIFDPPTTKSQRLRRELLGQNDGTKVTGSLQELVLELSRRAKIRISDLVRDGAGSFHTKGRAVDVGNEDIAASLLPGIATDEMVEELNIDELIFDASVAGKANRNEWNFDQGEKHNFNAVTLNQHKNHIHFAVKAD